MAPGSQFQYPSFGMGLLPYILSLKSGGFVENMLFDRLSQSFLEA
jgi:hypothetical protein